MIDKFIGYVLWTSLVELQGRMLPFPLNDLFRSGTLKQIPSSLKLDPDVEKELERLDEVLCDVLIHFGLETD